jgi:UPF0755 protein
VSGRYPGEQWPGEQWPGEQWPGEQWPGEQWPGEQVPGEQGYGEQGYPQDYGQAGDPRQGDPRGGQGEHGYAGDGRSRGGGGVWGADAPLPPTASRDTAWGERSLPPQDSFPQRAQPGRDANAFPRGQNGAQQRRGRQDGRDQRDRESFSSGPQRSQPGRDAWPGGPQQVQPDGAARRSAQRDPAQYGFPEYGGSPQPASPRPASPRPASPRHSGPNPQQDGRRAAHRDTGGYQMSNDYPDGDFVPGFGVPASDRDYGRDPDRDDWRNDRREDPRRGRERDRYGADDRYSGDRQVREDRYADDPYGDDGYGDDGYGAGRRGGTRPGDGRRGGERYAEGRPGDDQYPGDRHDAGRGAGGNERARYDNDEGRQPRRRRGRIRRLAPWIALLVLVIFLIPLVGGGLYAYHYIQAKDHPPDYVGAGVGPKVQVQVLSGDTPTSLAPQLVKDGVVESTGAFIKAAEASTNSASLEAGFYEMNRHMQASLAYAYLLNPKDLDQRGITVPEGKRVSQTLIKLSQGSGIPLANFQAVLKKQLAQLALPPYAKNNPEGYLFPATYPYEPHETALALLQAMVNRFAQEAQSANLPASVSVPANGGTVPLTTGQVIIVASLVQAEAGRDEDMPKIAEVIYNRLKIGMSLKLDSTVFYGLGTYGTSASDADISKPGPYNTYLNKGLPPTPIESPGDSAIQAALHPATGNLLYFYGCPNLITIFSPTTSLTGASC